MKKIVYTAAALLAFATSSASALTLNTVAITAKGTNPTTAPHTDPSTSVTPGCPPHDPKGCGILD